MKAHIRLKSLLAVVALAGGLLAPNLALAQSAAGRPPATPGPSTQASVDLTLDGAMQVVLAAQAKSRELGTKMDIAVVDAGGNLKAFVREDGAWLGSIDIAQKKARTARFFDMDSGEIGKLSQPGGPLYNIEVSNGGLISFRGGVPLKNRQGAIVGAIGVSGSSVENDHAVAAAGAAVLLR